MKSILEKLKEDTMVRYIPTELEVERLCDEYQVGKLVSMDGELGGLFNVNLKITTASGQYVIHVHSGLIRADHLNYCGILLRKFHNALTGEIDVPTPFWSNYPSHEVLKKGIYLLKEHQKELHDVSQIIEVEKLYKRVIEQWLSKESLLTKAIIHGDWHPWNVLFNEHHEIKYIIDFDFLQKGERIQDIAYFLWAIRNEENNDELGKHFLKG
ncbi:phosphotransferase enzyme family protein [Bacillota bacterium Lsc_1132]